MDTEGMEGGHRWVWPRYIEVFQATQGEMAAASAPAAYDPYAAMYGVQSPAERPTDQFT